MNNGTTIGEFIGWRLANQIAALQWLTEGREDESVLGFRHSYHGHGMFAFIYDLRCVLWPEPAFRTNFNEALGRLRGYHRDDPYVVGSSLYDDERGCRQRAAHSLLRELPHGPGAAGREDTGTLLGVLQRLFRLTGPERFLEPDAALAHHVEDDGREPSDGLRVPWNTRTWTIRHWLSSFLWIATGGLDNCPVATFRTRVDGAEAAASLLLQTESTPAKHVLTGAQVELACDRIVLILDKNGMPGLEQLRVRAGAEGHSVCDVLDTDTGTSPGAQNGPADPPADVVLHDQDNAAPPVAT